MAITPGQRDDILKVVVGLFGGAPGNIYLPELAAVVEGGVTREGLADLLADTAIFKTSIIGGNVTTEEQADILLSHFGLVDDGVEGSAGSEAKAYFVQKLTDGEGFGKIVSDAITYLEGTPAEGFASTATLLANKVKVAAAYSSQAGSTDLALLQTVLSKVTGDHAYNDADVQKALDDSGVPTGSGKEFNLIIGEDNLTGTAGDDVFKALVAEQNGGGTANTLENIDRLDGGAGSKDTLTATLDSGGAAPLLNNIENVMVRFASAQTLDLSNATGVQAITVNSSSGVGTVAGVADAADLSVRNQKQNVVFTDNTATSLNLDLDTVGTDETTRNTVTLDDGATSLNLTVDNAFADIVTLATVETLTVDATGANVITQGSGAVTTTATVTGTGSVELLTPFTALTTLTATDNSGGVTATVDADAVTVDGGSGADDITYTAALGATAAVNLAGGDDTFTIAAASGTGSLVDGGDDNDTLAVTNGVWLDTSAADVYSNFETLEIGGGTGTYDMANLPGLTAVTIGAALAGAADITNAEADTTVTVNAAASTDLALGQDLTFALADAAGSTDEASLTLNALDGDNNVTADGEVTVDSFESDDIETFNIASNVGGIDATLAGTDYTNEISDLGGDSVTTLNITGNANLDILFGALTTPNLSKVDATALTGALTIDADASGATGGVEFLGGSGDDDYTGTVNGDTIAGNGGADTIDLDGTFASVDTLILNEATDSQLNADLDGHDQVSGFGTAAGGGALDVIDVGAFGFTGQQKSALANKGGVANSVVDGSTTSVTDFFSSGGQDRGVAIGTNGGDTYVFIDVNKDGNFTAADDSVIQLAGVTDVTLANFGF